MRPVLDQTSVDDAARRHEMVSQMKGNAMPGGVHDGRLTSLGVALPSCSARFGREAGRSEKMRDRRERKKSGGTQNVGRVHTASTAPGLSLFGFQQLRSVQTHPPSPPGISAIGQSRYLLRPHPVAVNSRLHAGRGALGLSDDKVEEAPLSTRKAFFVAASTPGFAAEELRSLRNGQRASGGRLHSRPSGTRQR